MSKYAAILEYDGTHFHGWQTQSHLRNVQDCTAEAFSKVADHPVEIVCAGRTDAGVHARGQVVHFTSTARRSVDEWRRGVNSFLPEDIAVKHIQPVADDFHARFSAISRTYRYIILNCPERRALGRQFSTWIYKPLDASAMHRAVQSLVGEHDFSSFRAAGCQSKSPVRNVSEAAVRRQHDLVVFDVRANAFVQHMVRNIVGALLTVGKGEAPESWVAEVLAKRDRTQAGFAAPAQGLCLWRVEYPVCYELSQLADENDTAILAGLV